VNWKAASSEFDGKVVEPSNFKGLSFKFPFSAQKTTYKVWNSALREATPAKYIGDGTFKGMKVYKYQQAIEPIKTGTFDVPDRSSALTARQ
jgi:hypothetical protein